MLAISRPSRGLTGVGLAGLCFLSGRVLLAATPAPRVPFPVTFAGSGTSHGQPVIADLGLESGQYKQIIFGTTSHKLYVLLHGGTVAPGFPVTLPADIYSSPAVGDLDGDGNPDIVVGYGSTIENSQRHGLGQGPLPGGVRAYRRDGTQIWDRPSLYFNGANPAVGEPMMSTPAIGDVDGDGIVEVAWGGLDAYLYLVKGTDGTNKPGWPIFVRDTVFSSPALHDLNGDGKKEIIIGVDTHADPTAFPAGVPTIDGGRLHVIFPNGTEMPGFPKDVDQVIWSSPAVGDINGDGFPEIVVGTGGYYAGRAHRVYAWNCDGSVPTGWPVTVDGEVATSPALADIDGDGIPDVIVTDNNTAPSTTFHVYVFKGNGTLLWKRVPINRYGSTLNAGEPIVADIVGDSKPEVIVPTNTELCVFSSTGAQLTDDGTGFPGSFHLDTSTALSGGVVGDLDNDGTAVEIVAVSGSPWPAATDATVYVWSANPVGALPWPQYRQSMARTGVVPGTLSCQLPPPPLRFYTLAPCRIYDTRDFPGGPYGGGGPALPAQTSRAFVLAGQCGIPADAGSVSINLTVIPTTAGFLRYYPAGSATTTATATSFPAGRVLANNGMAKLGNGGALTIENGQATGSANIIIDTNGYYR
jgi:hypothetical protein